MFLQKRAALQPLIESRDGHHLTIYLVNSGNSESLKLQLNAAIDTCQDQLEPVLGPAKFAQFAKPVEALLHDSSFLKRIKSNVGIFRTIDTFRLIKIPLQLEYFCGVATSYHIKPLLRWLQLDREFVLFNVESNAAKIYHGSQYNLRLLESRSLSKSLNFQEEAQQTVAWMEEKISRLTFGHKLQIFAAGRKPLMQSVLKTFQKRNHPLSKNIRIFEHNRLGELFFEIRLIQRQDAIRELEQAFIEYHCADEIDMTESTIEEIAQAAIQGRVRKLIIAIGVHVFGKLDRKTGKVAIHARDMDHEDDDILDDLAQIVMEQGGEIVIANKNEMPKGKPALAILQHEAEPEATALKPPLLVIPPARAYVN